MKNIFIILALFFLPLSGKSQSLTPYRILDVGAGFNMNTAAGDAETFTRTKGLHLNFNYNFDIFTSLIAEIQLGQLAGGDSIKTHSGRQFTNQFNSFSLRGQVHSGKIFQDGPESMKKFYLSSGIGGIVNNITTISRSSKLVPEYTYTTAGRNQSINFFVPVRLGYELPIRNAFNESIIKIDLAYQYNFVLGDEIDGFTVGRFKDTFSQLSLGIKAGILGRKWHN